MTLAFSIHDRIGRLALTALARSATDAARAAEIGCDPRHAPYRVERTPMHVGRAALADWRSGLTTDKAVDLTANEGWDEL